MNKEIYRKDYQPSAFFIDTVHLTFELHDKEKTRVIACLSMNRNKDHAAENLILQGEEQELVGIKLNGKLLKEDEFSVDEKFLTLFNMPDAFEIEITSLIDPEHNTSLMGLYQSSGNFCTQCEAEGFRKITYYLDRPDVMAIFTTKIIADQKKYPVLLSNGNLVESGKLGSGKHFAVWHDPFQKPCYLFALVAANLAHLEDHFITQSGKRVTLKIFAGQSVVDKCHFAMEAIKKAMRWDEKHYGREYDLDIFMIAAVNDFNFGAMENKGLNIFNDKYILVDSHSATDSDYAAVDLVVGHEYFHNWSGNRVTLQDWFQISLKEGFTVFREESFTQTMGLSEVDRIQKVKNLRATQFTVDAGPLAHPVRPDSYIEMNNFYTTTVYEKGAELIRMMKIILGAEKYRAGTDLYFSRYDGMAVTCDDFVAAMSEAGEVDLTQFKLWYSQAGTPVLKIKTQYDDIKKKYFLDVTQHCPSTPGQPDKKPMHIPLAIGLLAKTGKHVLEKETVLNFKKETEHFTFENIHEKPVISLLRGFSAPVKIEYDYTEEELAFLMAYDDDGVARWEAGQQYATQVLLKLIKQIVDKKIKEVPKLFLQAFNQMLTSDQLNQALIAEMMSLPDEIYLSEMFKVVDVDAIVSARYFLKQTIAATLKENLIQVYEKNHDNSEYVYSTEAGAKRALKNHCLHYLTLLEGMDKLAYQQFNSSNNMTDQFAALVALSNTDSPLRENALALFYENWQDNNLVLDKWLFVQASAARSTVLEEVNRLLVHPCFSLKNPNKVRAVLGAFTRNFSGFHQEDGKGYELIGKYVLLLDSINPMGASRLAASFSSWRMFKAPRKEKMREELEKILAQKNISADVFEIVSKSLEFTQ